MGKQSVSYALKIYDIKLWERVVARSMSGEGSINKIINDALAKDNPPPKQLKEKK